MNWMRKSGPGAWIGALALVTLAACGESSTDPLESEILTRYQAWFARGITDYSFEYSEGCSQCPLERLEPVHITVRNGVITEVRSLETGELRDATPWAEVGTISGIYQRVLNHAEQLGATVVVEYDNQWDIPRYVQAILEGTAGAGFSVRVEAFKPE